uniref:F-box domain-containing protein n=1 Tax=Leersia perrieri TaxID=77586 RepID=A0A0D9W5C6_9ORYZ
MQGVTELLPDDVVVEIFSRVRNHRSLARCRCVHTAWRALVDDRGLLLPHPLLRAWGLLHHRHNAGHRHRAPLRLPAAVHVQDHCNGLLLCFHVDRDGDSLAAYVCNPATRRWACLPHPPAPWPRANDGAFLAFDAASPDRYTVFLLPVGTPLPRRKNLCRPWMTLDLLIPEEQDDHLAPLPSPSALLPLRVFSSVDGKWRRRELVPGRCAPVELYGRVMALCRRRPEFDAAAAVPRWRSASYGRGGAMYAHSESDVLVVVRCEEGTYDMVELPGGGVRWSVAYDHSHVIADLPLELVSVSSSSGHGDGDGDVVRYVRVEASSRVRIWTLDESSHHDGKLNWTLTHHKDLAAHTRIREIVQNDTPEDWKTMACTTRSRPGSQASVVVVPRDDDDDDDGWSSESWISWDEVLASAPELGMDDDDDDAGAVVTGQPQPGLPFHVMGFHPSKEVLFLAAGAFHVVAYHLGGSGKVQYLGRATSRKKVERVKGMFPYRPCLVDSLPPPPCLFPSLKTAYKSQSRR